MMIGKDETEIRCKVSLVGGQVVSDPACSRIDTLIYRYLQKICVTEGGWVTLYQDPADGRYWELTYPQSEQHGGGPPLLTWLNDEQVASKYKDALKPPQRE
jgi:hypothetical protein